MKVHTLKQAHLVQNTAKNYKLVELAVNSTVSDSKKDKRCKTVEKKAKIVQKS